MNGSATDRVLLIDIDFVTLPGLRNFLRGRKLRNKQALIIPAFEIVGGADEENMDIKSTEQLLKAWEAGKIIPFKYVCHFSKLSGYNVFKEYHLDIQQNTVMQVECDLTHTGSF